LPNTTASRSTSPRHVPPSTRRSRRAPPSPLTAPAETPVYNAAFDVTPAELIAAIITERGIFRFPYSFT